MAGTEALRGALEVGRARPRRPPTIHGAMPSPARCSTSSGAGPLSMLGLSPRDAYYGSQTTPAMFVIALSELWHWTGDERSCGGIRDAATARDGLGGTSERRPTATGS